MSDQTKRTLETAFIILSIATILVTVAKSFILTPERLDVLANAQIELRVEQKAIREARQEDNALLQRIDERTAQLLRDMQELKKH